MSDLHAAMGTLADAFGAVADVTERRARDAMRKAAALLAVAAMLGALLGGVLAAAAYAVLS